jgi:nucleotide-binding universal stress UspA family protein
MKKILVPVDDSIHSANAIQYILRMAPILQDTIYLLFYAQATVSGYLKEEAQKDPQAMAKLNLLDRSHAALGIEILNRHKERLMAQQVPEERIELLTQPRREGVAWDIIYQAWHESIDAIVMGRHGASRFRDAFIGSTTKNVIEHDTGIPIWMVDGEVRSRNILLAVDGSTDSIKALDYLCDMLRPDPDALLTVFHVQPSLRDCCGIETAETQPLADDETIMKVVEKANRQCVDRFMEHALRRLKELDIEPDRLTIKTRPSKVSIAKEIIDEFENGIYGTLVVGKRGVGGGHFMGSVSNHMVTHLKKGALWIVP